METPDRHNAHGLRDLAGLYRFDPEGQIWARSIADLLLDANAKATAARSAGQATLADTELQHIRCWYRGAVAKGIADNTGKTTSIAADGLTLARRFRDHEDMILRFAVDLAVGFTSNRSVMRSVVRVHAVCVSRSDLAPRRQCLTGGLRMSGGSEGPRQAKDASEESCETAGAVA